MTKTANTLEALTDLLANLEKIQALMKAANPLIKKGNRAALVALGLAEGRITQLLAPDFAGRIGFPAFELSLNNAHIKRVQAKIAKIAKLTTTTASVDDLDEVAPAVFPEIDPEFVPDYVEVDFEFDLEDIAEVTPAVLARVPAQAPHDAMSEGKSLNVADVNTWAPLPAHLQNMQIPPFRGVANVRKTEGGTGLRYRGFRIARVSGIFTGIAFRITDEAGREFFGAPSSKSGAQALVDDYITSGDAFEIPSDHTATPFHNYGNAIRCNMCTSPARCSLSSGIVGSRPDAYTCERHADPFRDMSAREILAYSETRRAEVFPVAVRGRSTQRCQVA